MEPVEILGRPPLPPKMLSAPKFGSFTNSVASVNTSDPGENGYTSSTSIITNNERDIVTPTNFTPIVNKRTNTRKNCRKPNYPTASGINQRNVNCILTSGRSLEFLPSSDEPYAIIKYGPTGSGKGSKLVSDEISSLGVPIENYAVFEIDSLVESAKNYRNKTIAIKSTYNSNSKLAKTNMYKELSGAYKEARNQLSKKLNNTLERAIKAKKNFIFETTGQFFSGSNPVEWLIKKLEDEGGNLYKIIVIYPIVKANLIMERVIKRAENASKRENKPLFRAINPNTIEPATYQSQLNLTHYIIPLVYANRIFKVIIVRND